MGPQVGGDQTMQMHGDLEGFSLLKMHDVWVGNVMTHVGPRYSAGVYFCTWHRLVRHWHSFVASWSVKTNIRRL